MKLKLPVKMLLMDIILGLKVTMNQVTTKDLVLGTFSDF